jgi:hypothetical protein
MKTVQEQRDKKNGGIAAALRRQPLLATCMDAMEEWKRRTQFPACQVSVDHDLLDANAAVWIDKPLFIEALADLLEFSARSSVDNNNLKFTVVASGTSSFRIMIDFTPSPAQSIESRSPYARSRFSSTTQQIISQHCGCLEFSESGRSSRIMIRFS